MPETETTMSAYQQAVEVFKSLTAITSGIDSIQRQRTLADGTEVVIGRDQIQDLTYGGPPLDTLYANIGGICNFALNRLGLKSFSLHPPFIKIGRFDIPAGRHLYVNWDISNMPIESHAVFREASQPLVSWLERVIDEDHYFPPPVTI